MLSKKEYLKFDLYRFTGVEYNFLLFIRKFIFNPGYRYVYFYRKASFYKKNNFFRWFYWFFLRRMQLKYHIQISDRTTIGHGLYLGHMMSDLIAVSNNCNINHGVTIGETSRGSKKGAPRIGNNVWFGANSITVGKIEIGDNVLVAPGAFVNFDVPSNSIVVGNPGKIIPNKNATSEYIKRIYSL